MPVEECLFTGDSVFILRIWVWKNNLLLVFIRSDDLVLLERVLQSYLGISALTFGLDHLSNSIKSAVWFCCALVSDNKAKASFIFWSLKIDSTFWVGKGPSSTAFYTPGTPDHNGVSHIFNYGSFFTSLNRNGNWNVQVRMPSKSKACKKSRFLSVLFQFLKKVCAWFSVNHQPWLSIRWITWSHILFCERKSLLFFLVSKAFIILKRPPYKSSLEKCQTCRQMIL